jgi:hypothetical protein
MSEEAQGSTPEPANVDELNEPTDEEKETEAELGPEQADDDGPEVDNSDEPEEELEDDDDGPEEEPGVPPGVASEVDDEFTD